MSSISITKLYDLLTAKVGRDTAENLTTFIEEKIMVEVESKTLTLASRMDLLATRIDHLATRMDLFATKEGVKKDIAEAKTEMIRWMFIFWVSQVVTTFGFILLFLKK